SGEPSIGPLATGEPFIDGFLEPLGGGTTPALLLPVRIKSRTVALVAAHGGDAAPDPRTIDALYPQLDVSARALARVLATRQRAATASIVAKRAETEGYEIEVSVSDVATKRAQLDKLREQGAWAELAEAI